MENGIIGYVQAHTERGACLCGDCIDAPFNPEDYQPTGHTSDVYFFEVSTKGEPDAEAMAELIRAHKGVFGACDPLDGDEHSYIELGGWIGDQGLALMMMGLGELLGMWRMMTPKHLPGLPKGLMDQMAGSGLVVTMGLAD